MNRRRLTLDSSFSCFLAMWEINNEILHCHIIRDNHIKPTIFQITTQWPLFTALVILDVNVDLLAYFTEEQYYSAYEGASAREALQEKIKDNVSVVFRYESFYLFFSFKFLCYLSLGLRPRYFLREHYQVSLRELITICSICETSIFEKFWQSTDNNARLKTVSTI